MTPRSTVRLPLAVLVAVAGALGALTAGRPELALLASPWVVLLILGLTSARPGDIRAAVELDADRVLVGEEVTVEVTVVANGPGWVVAEPLPASTFWPSSTDGPGEGRRQSITGRALGGPPGDRAPARAELLTPGQPVTIACPLQAEVWGGHDLGRVGLTIHQTHGLVQWSGVTTESRRVRVHPTPMQLRQLIAPWLVRRQVGTHRSPHAERGVEFADIRPFGAGDSLRDINWRASARSGELWVSERHPERATEVVLLLDSFIESGHDVRTVVGLAIEAAVALAESHVARTDRIGLIELGGVVRWVTPGTGQHQLQRLTDSLLATGLHANAAERDLTVVPLAALPPRSFVVALSPLLDPRFVDALFALRSTGHDVVVIDCLPEVEVHSVSEASLPAERLWRAERAMTRDRLAEHRVAVARWRQGDHLDVVLDELIRWRAGARIPGR